MNDPFSLIRKDHESIEALFKEYELMEIEAVSEKATLMEKMLRELKLHTKMEEMLCYPVFREVLPPEDAVLAGEAAVDHQEMKAMIDSIRAQTEENEKKHDEMLALIGSVRGHVRMEEEVFLPKVAAVMLSEAQTALASDMITFMESRGGIAP